MKSPPQAGGHGAGQSLGQGLGQVAGLDALRFAAAGLVMLYHLACTSWLVPSSEAAALLATPVAYPGLLPLSAAGWIGVPIFFVISGFVIAYTAASAAPGRFLENRFLRLMPCAWFCASLSFVLALGFAPEGATELLGRYLRTLVLFPAPRWIDGVYWTLGIEISFYAFVFALLAIGRADRLEPAVAALGLASALAWCLAASPLLPGLDVLISTRIAKLLLVTHGCEFALGVVFWAAAGGGWTGRRLLVAGLCLAGSLCQIGYDARFTRNSLGLDPTALTPLLVPVAIYLGFLGLFLLSVRFNAALLRGLGRGAPALRALGLSTYPLYLLHTFVGVLAMRAALALGTDPAMGLTLGIAASVAAALAVSGWIEPGLRAALRRRIDRHLRPRLGLLGPAAAPSTSRTPA
ncbi:acyltransferase family protein [Methylobacterium sp. Leaf118]|uniref:acyltransferase family protein n=1 Tax=Methylobacterium sp. Leaf118 TaxID=2876562 RepID=UPI001E3EBCBA|nr:acyltransferase [Methylobacterium sp. Leaf118]